MDRKQTEALSRETLSKFKKLDDKETNEYMKQYFQRTWEHFDVNNDNYLDFADMPAFEKYLASDQSLDLDA